MSISLRSHPILSNDAARGVYDASRVDEARVIRAAQITLRREIFRHIPQGPEREKRLNWLAGAVAAGGSKRGEAPERAVRGASAARSPRGQPDRNGNGYSKPTVVAFAATVMLALIAKPVAARETCPSAFDQMGAIMRAQADMFAALENEDQPAWQRSTVRDFLAYEGGRRYGRTEFFELIQHAHANGRHFSWSMTRPRLEMDCTLATLVYVNQGYVIRGSSWSAASWLETTTFRYAAGTWRAVFVESMRVNADNGSATASLGE